MNHLKRWLPYVCLAVVSVSVRADTDGDQWEKYLEQARLFREKGAYWDAEKAALAAVKEAEKSGRREVDVAKAWNSLAAIYYDIGRYTDAESLFRRSVEVWERVLGPSRTEVVRGLNNLGALYLRMGRFKDAESVSTRALAIKEKNPEADDRDLAETLNNLGELCRSQGRYAEAEPSYQRAIAIWEKTLGPTHPVTATARNEFTGR